MRHRVRGRRVEAAYQRGYFGDDRAVNCRTFGDTALTILAGPLNYFSVNPKIECDELEREPERRR